MPTIRTASPMPGDPDEPVPGRIMQHIPSKFSSLANLLEANKRWARAVERTTPGFFARLAKLQTPKLMWIGCSDSRVPANQIVNLEPGEVFVHRNVANVVVHTDFNCLSVLQYAVDVLRVEHIVVCGHYGCGGVDASLTSRQMGLIDNWLLNVKDVASQNSKVLDTINDFRARSDKLCELNVARSMENVCKTPIVQNAWRRRQKLSVHGWCYGINDGLIRDLSMDAGDGAFLPRIHQLEAFGADQAVDGSPN